MLALLLVGSGALAAGPFSSPGEGPIPFRRDQIPMNVYEIRELSSEFVVLAKSQESDSPESRRLAAQQLALSLALNPVNAEARRVLEDFERDKHRSSKSHRVSEIRDNMMKEVDWLQAALAGEDANALSNCMRDALRGSGDGADEKGKWKGWVPELVAYQKKRPKPEIDPKDNGSKEDPFDDPKEPKPAQDDKFKLKVAKSGIITPIWHPSHNGGWDLKPSLVEMVARHDEKSSESFALMLGEGYISDRWNNYANWVEGILGAKLGPLPSGLKVNIIGNNFVESLGSGRSQAISAPAALLANAAISGRETKGIVIGKLDEKGNFLLPSAFWEKLQAFGKGNGERMVLPKGAQPYMDAMLAFEQPEFFLEYEVVYAPTFEDLVKETSKELDDYLASASAEFKLIQKHADPKNPRRYIANVHVKKRLQNVLKLDPNHVSAKMLLTQGNGDRPTRIPRKVLVEELKRVMKPVSAVKGLAYWELEEGVVRRPNAKAIYELVDKPLDRLERYLDRDDKELYKQAQDVHDAVRELDRALGSRGPYNEILKGISGTTRNVAALNAELDRVLKEELKK